MHRVFIVAFVLLLAGCGAVSQPDTPTAAPQASPLAATISASNPTALATQPEPTAASIPTAAPTAPAAPTTAPADPTQAAQSGPPQTIPPFMYLLQLREPPDEGDEVRAVQQLLTDLGYTQVGAIDGIFGSNTGQAVRDFQRDNGLAVDGIVGPRTWARLHGSAPVAGENVYAVVESNTTFLLGASINGRWIDASAAAGKLEGNEAYRFVDSKNQFGNTTGGVAVAGEIPCEFAISVPLASAEPVSDTLAVGGRWDVFPRVREDLAVDTPVYQQEVRDLLVAKGIANPEVRITRIVRADLDGDGSDEVLISASRYADDFIAPSANAGDYSLVVLRKVVNGTVETIPLTEEYYPQRGEFVAPSEYNIQNVLDLNGDGTMEVVLHGGYYEGQFTQVFAVEGTTIKATALGSGCGV